MKKYRFIYIALFLFLFFALCFYVGKIIMDGNKKKIILYLDPASLPALNQLLHFTENNEDKNQIRVFGFTRFNLPKKVLDEYKHTHMIHLDANTPRQEDINKVFDQYEGKISLDIHLNLPHVFDLLAPIINYQIKNPDKIEIKNLLLYDDGAIDYERLDQQVNKDIAQEWEQAKNDLAAFMNNPSKQKISNPTISRYALKTKFNCKFFFLRPDYFDKTPSLALLKSFLKGSYTQMIGGANIKRFADLSKEKQTFYLQLIGFDEATKKPFQSIFQNNKSKYVFIGTTTWNKNERSYIAQEQVRILKNFVQKYGDLYVGDDYLIYFKGHPKGEEINKFTIDNVPGIINIPSHISFEVLIMAGFIPTKVGGMQSSIYLLLPEKMIGSIVCIPNKNIKTKEDVLKTPYFQVLLKLVNVKPNQIVFWDNLKKFTAPVKQ